MGKDIKNVLIVAFVIGIMAFVTSYALLEMGKNLGHKKSTTRFEQYIESIEGKEFIVTIEGKEYKVTVDKEDVVE